MARALEAIAVHGPPPAQGDRFTVNSIVDERTLREVYLPQFEACVREGKVGAVMPAYNRVDGVPCAASPRLLDKILRTRLGFGGFVVSDCGAIDDVYREHRVAGSAEEAAAMALRAGTDLNCGGTYRALTGAVKRGLVTEAEIDRAVGAAKEAYSTWRQWSLSKRADLLFRIYHLIDAHRDDLARTRGLGRRRRGADHRPDQHPPGQQAGHAPRRR